MGHCGAAVAEGGPDCVLPRPGAVDGAHGFVLTSKPRPSVAARCQASVCSGICCSKSTAVAGLQLQCGTCYSADASVRGCCNRQGCCAAAVFTSHWHSIHSLVPVHSWSLAVRHPALRRRAPLPLRAAQPLSDIALVAILFCMQCGILPYAGVDICLFELLNDGLLQRYDGEPPHIAICHTACLPASAVRRLAQCWGRYLVL